MKTIASILFISLFQSLSWAQPSCLTAISEPLHDALAALLEVTCPKNVLELRSALKQRGFQLQTTMVANRGFHNPLKGSFSLFEMAVSRTRSSSRTLSPGEFFFGHFTAPQGSRLILDQQPRSGSLMVELIAWDPVKKMSTFMSSLATELWEDGFIEAILRTSYQMWSSFTFSRNPKIRSLATGSDAQAAIRPADRS